MERLGRIVLIGAGNVASHLAPELDRVGQVVQVMSRDITHASRVAASLRHAQPINDPSLIVDDADVYVVSVNDDSIARVAADTPSGGLWVHTSGSVAASILAGHKRQYGVLYPLQTFTRGVDVDFSKVPLFIEGSDDETTIRIETLARAISDTVVRAGSDERKRLHIAAVLACNFTNHLWALADSLLRAQDMDFTVLEPLLRATVDKAFAITPAAAQTGPAARHDMRVIESHIASLPQPTADIYRLLSQSIMDHNTVTHTDFSHTI